MVSYKLWSKQFNKGGLLYRKEKQSSSFQSTRVSNIPTDPIWCWSPGKFLKSFLVFSLCGNPDEVASNISEGVPP